MHRTIDRDSGIFDKATCDKINVKSDELYKKIQDMYIPPIPYKESVTEETFSFESNYQNNNAAFHGFRVGHVIQCDITIINPPQNQWVKIGDVQTAPLMDLLYSNTNGSTILKIERGTTSLYIYTLESNPILYFWYII